MPAAERGSGRRTGPDSLAAFVGVWRLERTIEDRRAGQRMRFEGQAVFTAQADGLLYTETGTLHLPLRPPIAASRRYCWAQEGDRIAVRFADGRPFHDFALDTPGMAEHRCAADRYRVRYDFCQWPEWTAVWDVTGPRKDYAMLGRYLASGGALGQSCPM